MHEWIVGIALLVLSCLASVLGWIVLRFIGDLDKLEENQEELREVQHKYGREIRDTRQAVSRVEGKLDMEPFPYTSE
jgi:uncharacterized membrane protein (DUF106 family)